MSLVLALQLQPFKLYWKGPFGNRGTIDFAVELPPEPSSPDIYDIQIKVHGCDNTLPATFSIIFEVWECLFVQNTRPLYRMFL